MTPTSRLRGRMAFAALALAGMPAAFAATETWNNFTAGTHLWSVDANWLDATAPFNADPTLDVLFPGGLGSADTSNDLAGLLLNTLTLEAAAGETFAIAGNSLDFRTDDGPAGIIQNGEGTATVSAGIITTDATTMSGAGAGVVTLGGVISGGGGVSFTGGNWLLTNTGNTFSGALSINTGARVEISPAAAAPQNVNFAAAAAGLLGNATLTINGGTLKLTSKGTGNLALGGARPVIFGANGGTLDLRNNSGNPAAQGGNIASGDLALTLNNAGGDPAVIQWSGGEFGLSSNNLTNGDHNIGSNTLRISSINGTGSLRVELTNGAMMRGSLATGATADNNYAVPMTIRGVIGGDPTSGPDGLVATGVSRTTGRVQTDSRRENYNGGLTLEGAMVYTTANRATAINGAITIAGNGHVAFQGRGTGTGVSSAIQNPGGATSPGHNVLWIGEDANTTLTIQNGGIGFFDGRNRVDQNNAHGVLLGGNAVLNAGGTLRIAQSISNFSAIPASVASNFVTTQNSGDIILRGDLTAQGTTASEAVLDIKLPAPVAGGTIANGTPTPLAAAAPAAGTRPFAGLVAETAHGITIDGTGFGGLKVQASARPDRLFSATGAPGGAAMPDPTPNLTKIDAYLTAARLAGITGSGGYLTPAPIGQTYAFPAGGEWGAGVSVGLRVTNHNSSGTDVSLGALSSWGHNLAVDAGASLDLGAANPFNLTAGTLHGEGTVTGSLAIGSAVSLAPGMASVGSITLGNLTLDGTLSLDLRDSGAGDSFTAGNLTLGASSVLSIAAGSSFSNGPYTIATYSGALTGAFGSVVDLPLGYEVDYSTPGQVRLVFTAVNTILWRGSPENIWSTSPADTNWQGDLAFADNDAVTFDDSAAGSKNVVITGTVTPSGITVDTATAYTITASAGNTIQGGATLTKEGAGTLTLTGPLNYNGGTVISGGTLLVGADNTLPNSGPVLVAAGATLDLNGRTDTVGSLILNGTITTGDLTVGALSLGASVNTAVDFTLNGNLTKSGAASVMSGPLDLGGGNRSLEVAASGGTELTVTGQIANGAITKTGLGQLVLMNAGNAQSSTTVNGGTLTAGVPGAIPANHSAVTGAGGTLDLNNLVPALASLDNTGTTQTGGSALTVSTLSGAAPGVVEMGGGKLTIDQNATSTYGGAIAGAGTTVEKLGTGVLTLSGASTFDGGLTITAGRVNANSAGAGGTGGITVAATGTLQFGAAVNGPIHVNGGTISSSIGTNIVNGDLFIDAPSTARLTNLNTNGTNEMILNGRLRGTGDLNVLSTAAGADGGPGLRLQGTVASDYSGTITANQRVKLELQSSTAVNFSTAGTGKLVFVAGTATGGLQGTYSQLQTRVNSADLSTTFGNDVEVSGTGIVNFNVIGAANTTATMGNLRIGGGQTMFFNKNDATARTGVFQSVTLTGGGAATFSVQDPSFGSNAAGVGPSVQLGDIGESTPGAGVTFRSAGATHATITGTSSYTGPTTVATGTLSVGLTGSIASSPQVNIATGATLNVSAFAGGYVIPAAQTVAGTGQWNGLLAFSGSLSPGDTAGQIATISGTSAILDAGATWRFDLSAANTTSDHLTLAGAFTKGTGGTYLFDFLGGGAPDTTYSLVSFGSTDLTASDFDYINLGGGLDGDFTVTADELLFTTVPEPGTALLLLGGLGLCAARRRRAA